MIFSALAWEVRPVLDALGHVRPDALPGFRSWLGSAGDVPVRVVRTGMGHRRAAAAAQQAGGAAVRAFLVTGCAGALRPDLAPGDLVCASSVVDEHGRPMDSGTAPVARALQQWAAARGLTLHAGCCVSVTRPLTTAAGKRTTGERFGAIAVDMEAGAIAAVAATSRVAFVGVRAILDPADMALPDLGIAGDAAGGREPGLLRPLVAEVLRRPAVLSELARLAPMRRAAQCALAGFFRTFVDGGGAAIVGDPATPQ